MNYWTWFFRDSNGGKAGFKSFIDWWLVGHLAIGFLLSWFARKPLEAAASTVLLPLAGVLVGLSFAWAANAQALLQTDEIVHLSRKVPGGLSTFAFKYLTAILIILVTLVLWGMAGLDIFDKGWPGVGSEGAYFFVKLLLYSISSLAMRECWHVVAMAQFLLLARLDIKDALEQRSAITALRPSIAQAPTPEERPETPRRRRPRNER